MVYRLMMIVEIHPTILSRTDKIVSATGLEILSTVVTSESIFSVVVVADFADTDISPKTDWREKKFSMRYSQ